MKSNDESTAQREGVGALGAGAEPAKAEPPAGAVTGKGGQGDRGSHRYGRRDSGAPLG